MFDQWRRNLDEMSANVKKLTAGQDSLENKIRLTAGQSGDGQFQRDADMLERMKQTFDQ